MAGLVPAISILVALRLHNRDARHKAGHDESVAVTPFASPPTRRSIFMIYELRVYQCVPGKLPALLKRFEDHTLKIWEQHGIRPAGFWTVLVGDGSNDLHYLLAWESLAEREKVWGAFQVDPAWIKVRTDTEKDGPIIANVRSSFLKPTAFSSVK
jgi:hypothetical protein